MKAVCIFSGGADSASMAAYLKSNGYELYLITFYYGQRSKREIEVARIIGRYLNAIEHKIIDIGFMHELYGKSNILTNDTSSIPERFDYSIVVPVRNAIFLSIASAWAFSINAPLVAYGAHTSDTNYPDCREEFTKAFEHSINLAEADGIRKKIRESIRIWSPALENMSKSDLLRAGYKILGDRLFETWSCYTDGIARDTRILQCGRCESCINRKQAFKEAGIEDRTCYE